MGVRVSSAHLSLAQYNGLEKIGEHPLFNGSHRRRRAIPACWSRKVIRWSSCAGYQMNASSSSLIGGILIRVTYQRLQSSGRGISRCALYVYTYIKWMPASGCRPGRDISNLRGGPLPNDFIDVCTILFSFLCFPASFEQCPFPQTSCLTAEFVSLFFASWR
nr:unnamed protein product [Spirometra erinaceieuropaei]